MMGYLNIFARALGRTNTFNLTTLIFAFEINTLIASQCCDSKGLNVS